MKVHVVLDPEVRKSERARQIALKDVFEVAGVQAINEKRFERYGMLAVDVADEKMDDLRQLEHVQSVTPDGIQRTR